MLSLRNSVISDKEISDVAKIDKLLPFKGKEVTLIDISYFPEILGRYSLKLELRIGSDYFHLLCKTTDVSMIAIWREGGNEQAIRVVLKHNRPFLMDRYA